MANNLWKGDAAAVAQVVTIQVTGYDAATTYRITIGNKVVSVLGTTDAAGTASALQAALAASTIAEFQEVTWTVSTDTVTGTAATAGVPFTATSSVSGGTGTIGSVTTTTSSAGPSHWGTAANWSLGTVPVSTDVVYVSGGASILYDLDQSAVTLGGLYVRETFTGDIGLPEYNASGYKEYRATYLKCGVTNTVGVHIGTAGGSGGSGRIKHDASNIQCSWYAHCTGTGAEQGVPAVLLKGSHASNIANIERGSLGIAFLPGETATVATVSIGYRDSQATDADVVLGDGCTLTTVKQNGGTLSFGSSVTTLTQRGGTATARNAANVSTLDSKGGRLNHQSSGTVGGSAVTLGKDSVLDLSGDPRAKGLGNPTMYAGSSLLDPAKTASGTPAITLSGCGLDDVTIDLGSDIVLTRS